VRIEELLVDTTGRLNVNELVQVSRETAFFEIKDGDYVEVYGLGHMLDGGHGVVMKKPEHYIKVASTLDLSMSSGEVAVVQGGSGSNNVTVALMHGQPQMVLNSLNCSSGLPFGASCSFGGWSGKAGEFIRTLTIDTSLSTPTGSYTITVTGTAEGHTGTTSFTLRVDPLVPYPLTVALVALAAGVGSFAIGFITGRKNEPTEPFPLPSSYQHEGFGFLTVSGRKAANEDSVLVSEVKSGSYLGTRRKTLFLIADGVGGREAGEMASLTACKIVAENLSAEFADASKPLNHLALMTSAVLSANAQILALASSEPQLQGMATTLTAAVVDQDTLYIAHVGNCRAFLIRSGTITQLTQDHTYVQELLDKGRISHEQARIHPRRNVITRAVGNREHLLVGTYKYEVGRADQLLLCTDGLSDYVSSGEALHVIQQAGGNLQGACEALADLALRKGSNDNISVIVATLRAAPPGIAYA
jgi:protein phosphatase